MGIKLTAVLLFLFTTVSFVHAGQNIQYMTEQNPPYNFEKDGKLQGIAVDLLLEMSKQTGQPVALDSIKILPWPRAYREAQKTAGTSLFSMARTEQREELFKWVGPIMELTIGLVAPKDKQLKINSADDLNGLKVGSIRDGAPEQMLLKAGFPEQGLDRAPSPEQNIKKLVAGRFDALAFNIDSTFYSMKVMGLDPTKYENVYFLKKIQLYFAYNKETDDAVIKALNAALKTLKTPDDSGTSFFDRTVSSYLNAQ